jgi:deoxyribodipyrimidine photo-lyase
VALFVFEPGLLNAASAIRHDQLLGHLQALNDELTSLGGALVVRTAPSTEAIAAVVAECEATAVYLNVDPSPFSTVRDAAVAAASPVPVRIFHGLTAHEPGAVLTKRGALSEVFSPFFKTWHATPFAPWPKAGEGRLRDLPGLGIPTPGSAPRHQPGERAASDRLARWLDNVDDYLETRDLPSIPGTSDLSADLKFGTIAARTVVDETGTATPGRAGFTRQIAWRDWWAHLLTRHPNIPNQALRPAYDKIAWRDDDTGFDAWCNGTTGYPLVDAGMRQLAQTGWMHNRVRMVSASFLIKDLLIDWRRGERFFRHHLVDADVAQNAGNWQWVAGTGPDAAPYFRIFNPTTQSKRFDPSGDYIRTWVPELAGLNDTLIHEPTVAAPLDLAGSGVVIGDNYPAPIISHSEARTRTLAVYKQARE